MTTPTTTTAATAGYDPLFPIGTKTDDKLRAFISNFYAVSDDPDRNEEWLSYFEPDAVLVMGDKVARGTEEIRAFRRGMWEHVGSRRHRPTKVFPASFSSSETGTEEAGTLEYMLHGSLDLGLKSGDASKVTWAGRAVVREDEEGVLRFALYQVYMHSVSAEIPL